MDKKEAEKIVEDYYYWQDKSCACHICPPCSKCTDSPSEEEYNRAVKFLEGG
jgi:hypothetical protein